MRSFIAVDFDAELKKSISDIQADIRRHAVSGRWKYIDNFHLTLKFLDEIDLKKAAQISRTLRDMCSSIDSFGLRISDLGYFPGRDSIRVLWLGIGGDTSKLKSVHEELDIRLQKLGFDREKRSYTPHVTIGQNVVLKKDLKEISRMIDFKKLPAIHVDKIILYRSEQIGRKRVYTPMNEFMFKK